jgi:hypothetical protein
MLAAVKVIAAGAVLVGAAVFTQRDAPAAAPDLPSLTSVAPAPDDGCDQVNIQQGDYPLTPADRDRLIRQSIAVCRAVTGSLDGGQ